MSGQALRELALFPLRTVLFPGGALPLRIFEPRYVDMVRDCLRDERPFGVVPILHGPEAGAPADFHPSGVLADIESWDLGDDGLLHLLGEDDHDDDAFERMHHREDQLLTAMGLGPVFRSRSADGQAMPGEELIPGEVTP